MGLLEHLFRFKRQRLAPAAVKKHAEQFSSYQRWQKGYGPIVHHTDTQAAVIIMANDLVKRGLQPNIAAVYDMLHALDHLSAAGMWLVVHMTYANRVRLDGRHLQGVDFKEKPEGHTGGSLNMVPGYAA